MNTYTLLVGTVSAAFAATAVNADIDISLDNFKASGLEFDQFADPSTGVEELAGTLTGFDGNFVLNEDALGGTRCEDLCILIGNEDLSLVLIQIGGTEDYTPFVENRYEWSSGASGLAGTTGGGSLSGLSFDLTGLFVFVGNVNGDDGGIGNWSGNISLTGASFVPAPGTLALLGLAGFGIRRRRA